MTKDVTSPLLKSFLLWYARHKGCSSNGDMFVLFNRIYVVDLMKERVVRVLTKT